jgi:hypothetical protein
MSPSRTADQYSFILKGLAGAVQGQLRQSGNASEDMKEIKRPASHAL